MKEDDFDRVSRQGMKAWQRLKKDKNWSDWVQVGESLLVGREWAMHQAGTNQPQGKGYNVAFGEWLARYKLDDMDKGDRSRLFSCMENLPAIEEWRKSIGLTKRLALNSPNAVWRNWKTYIEPEKKPDPNVEPKPTLKDSVVNLSEENRALKLHIEELEAARGLDDGEREFLDIVREQKPDDHFRVTIEIVDGLWEVSLTGDHTVKGTGRTFGEAWSNTGSFGRE